jgi:osmotically-inducible protein OsmY
MGFLQRLFGLEKPKNPQQAINPTPAPEAASNAPAGTATSSIPPERVGLNGEYDQSGLAKRVALAFDEDPEVANLDNVYVAQTGGTVVLKGKVPNQQALSKLVSIARSVNGATSVETNQVQVG